MRGFLLGLLAAGFVLLGSADGQGVPPASLASDSFPISLVDNRVFVGVEVDGHGPFAFLLDTGSSSVTVEQSLAARLRLKSVGAGTTDGAGESRVDYATVHLASAALGKCALGPMDVPSLDNAKLARAVGFRHFDGVLGADIFRGHVVIIDAARGELTVTEPGDYHPGREAVAAAIDLNGDETPVIDAKINGIAGRFLVDTGDRSSLTLFGPFWRANRLDRGIGPAVTAMTGYGVGGPIRAVVGRPKSFAFGGMTLPAPVTRLSLQKAGVFASGDYAGSIGMGVLKRFIVSFDYGRKTLWLAKSPDFAQPDRYDRSGAWLGLDDKGHLTVMDVVASGPAAKAGIEPGDTILSVSGLDATPAHLFEIRALLKQPGLASVEFHLMRNHQPKTATVSLRDLIAPPT